MLLHQTYPADAGSVARIRHAVVEAARRAGVETSRLDAVALAVSEAATNAVVHAYDHDRRGAISVEVSRPDGALQVQIVDDGVGMRPPRCDRGGLGLGLSLIASATDSVDIRHGLDGTGTRLIMRFAPTEREPDAVVSA